MARRKLLSNDIEKMIKQLNSFAEQYDVKNAKEFWRLEKTLSEWKISCLVEEALTPKGENVTYCTEKMDDPLDFFSER